MNQWEADQRHREHDRGRGERPAAQDPLGRPDREPMPRQEQRKKRKRRQDVVRQLRFHDAEDDDNNRGADDEIKIERVALLPEPAGEPGQFPRPRREGEEDGEKIKRQRNQSGQNGTPTVALHRAKGAAHDMPPEADFHEFTLCLDECGHAPECDEQEDEENSPNEKKTPAEMTNRPKSLEDEDRA